MSRGIYTITKIKPDYVELTTKGIPYNFDNRTGRLNIWNLSLFLDGAETKAREPGVFMNIPLFPDKSSTLVMIKQVLKVNPKVFHLDYMNSLNLKITKQLGQPGSTTYNTTTKLMDENSEIFVEKFVKLGRIDNVSRRSVKNSDEFMKTFAYLNESHGIPHELMKNEIPEPPVDAFKWKLTIRYSDLDVKMHANQSMYIKSCIDCATDASIQGKLVHFSGDMIWYPVVFVSINYLGENFANDELVVNMWQDTHNVSLFQFLICKDLKPVAFVVCNFGLNKI